MKIIVQGMVVVMACALSGMAQEVRTAGTLLVDLSADAVTAADGDAIAQWANAGTLGGNFAPLTGSSGPTFTNSLLGKKALNFSGTVQSVLTNGIAPASLTGVNPWSVETWVWVPALPAPKSIYLSWTQNEGAAGYQQELRMMLRYDSGNGAIDHRGVAINFGYGIPPAGTWHHIVVTRSSFGTECLYVDGNFSALYGGGNVNLESGKPLALGAVLLYGTAQYTNFFAGSLSRVRIHTGTLSEQDVRNNYLVDAWAYRAAISMTWTGGAGNWNDASNWAEGLVGNSSNAVRFLSGAVTVTNDDVSASSLSSLDIVSGTVNLVTSAARIDSRAPFVVGRNAGNAAEVNLPSGVVNVVSSGNPAFMDFGLCGASSTLSVGGAGGSSVLYASQLRVFAGGSADMRVKSGGLLELDSVFSDTPTNVTMSVAGGTLRNKAGSTMGYLYNVPQVRVSTGGVIFDAVTNSQMVISSSLLHDESGPAAGGGLRKISAGRLVLSATNTYAGETSVEAGTLVLSPRLSDGLVYRLDAHTNALATLQLEGTSNVVAWADANGSGILFTTNKTEKCPVYDAALFGGRGGLRFTRDSTICRLAANRAVRAQSVFAVISPASGNAIGGVWGKSEEDYGIRVNGASVQYVGNGNDFATAGWIYMNGVFGNAFTVGQPVLMTAVAGSAQNWMTAIGDYWGHTTHRRVFKGDIAEVLVYDRRLDDRERREVEAYLMAKWLGTVPAPEFGSTLLPINNALSILNGASVELGGTSAQLSALKGVGRIGNGSATRSSLAVGGLDADSVYAGSITGNVAVTKIGSGRVILAGPNTYAGATTVESGTLMLATGVSSVTGIVYRLDASKTNTFTTLSDGSNVTTWADAEGSGFTFATTNDLNCPVYDATLFGGRGGLRFGRGGARGRMIGASVTNAQTVFAVNMIRDGSNDNGGFWGKNGEDNGLRIGNTTWYFPGNANDFHYVTAGGLVAVNGVVSNSVATVGQPHLVTSVNGSRQSFKPAIGDYWGSSTWPNRYYRGEVAEILVYDRRLTDLERQTVEASLMAKWFSATSGSVLPQAAAVSVAAGATLDLSAGAITLGSLSGGGSVSNGALAVTGAVSPSGTLKLPGTPNLTGTLTLNVEANGACDSLAVGGALNLSQLALVLNLPGTKPSVNSYTLVSAPGGVTGTFTSAAITGPWKLVYGPSSIRLVYISGTLISIR
jgi:autotransporter-associated beta strand protein